MDHHAAYRGKTLVRVGEDLLHMAGRYPGIGSLNGHAGFHCVNAGKLARHAHVDLADLALGLIFRLADGFLNGFVQGHGVVPFALQKAVVHGNPRADNITALRAAGFGHQRHDLRRAKINCRNG